MEQSVRYGGVEVGAVTAAADWRVCEVIDVKDSCPVPRHAQPSLAGAYGRRGRGRPGGASGE